jgi:hypothetical protein
MPSGRVQAACHGWDHLSKQIARRLTAAASLHALPVELVVPRLRGIVEETLVTGLVCLHQDGRAVVVLHFGLCNGPAQPSTYLCRKDTGAVGLRKEPCAHRLVLLCGAQHTLDHVTRDSHILGVVFVVVDGERLLRDFWLESCRAF